VCGSNTSNGSIVEGDHLQMWCSVNYSGNLAPVMEWSRSDGRIVDSTVIYSNDTFPRTVLSSSFQMTNYSDHYACKTYFKKAHVDSQKEGTSSATNAPDYQAECNLTLNVLCKSLPLLILSTGVFMRCISQFEIRIPTETIRDKMASRDPSNES